MSNSGFFKKIMGKKFKRQQVLSKHKEVGQHSVVLVLDHLKPGFNVAKIFRSANAFGVSEVFLVGIESFDVRAAMGAFKHTKHRSFKNYLEAHTVLLAEGYTPFALTPERGILIHEFNLPKKTAFIVGHEEDGLSFDPKDFESMTSLSIAQFGKVQSLNVSVAASIAVYEYLRQHVLKK
jgi:tRNA G18 (ribose-2'-O)-methylase SpoU